MFGLFKKDITKKLDKKYALIMEKAVHAQRNGKLELYGELIKESEKISKEIDTLKAQKKQSYSVSTFNRDWNKLGLYYIPSDTGYQSYFLKRSWGNYLFFPHAEIEQTFSFIIASGGLYKVFDKTLPFKQVNQKLFNKFGAPTIGTLREFHPDFQIEKYGEQYQDIDMTIENDIFTYTLLSGEVFTFIDNESLLSKQENYTLPRIVE